MEIERLRYLLIKNKMEDGLKFVKVAKEYGDLQAVIRAKTSALAFLSAINSSPQTKDLGRYGIYVKVLSLAEDHVLVGTYELNEFTPEETRAHCENEWTAELVKITPHGAIVLKSVTHSYQFAFDILFEVWLEAEQEGGSFDSST